VDPLTVIVIFFAAIGLAMLGSIIAAWRAARVWPVEALRYE
jgi:ABC-type lipoprotein release transport system permease subunit